MNFPWTSVLSEHQAIAEPREDFRFGRDSVGYVVRFEIRDAYQQRHRRIDRSVAQAGRSRKILPRCQRLAEVRRSQGTFVGFVWEREQSNFDHETANERTKGTVCFTTWKETLGTDARMNCEERINLGQSVTCTVLLNF